MKRFVAKRLAMVLCISGLVAGVMNLGGLKADKGDEGRLTNGKKNSGNPNRGGNGWINLPYLKGLAKLDQDAGKKLFNGLKALHDQKGCSGDYTAGASFVIEGMDAYVAGTLITKGSPTVQVSPGQYGWEAIITGPFEMEVDPLVIQKEHNYLGAFMPFAGKGAVIRISCAGLKDIYVSVEDEQVQLNWKGLLALADSGFTRITFEGYTSDGDVFEMEFYTEIGYGKTKVRFGRP